MKFISGNNGMLYSHIGRTMLFCCFILVTKAFLSPDLIFAQQTTFTVSGKVALGANATDLSGTSVQVKGGSKGVATDGQGHFSISIQKGITLVISHIGYKPVEIRVTAPVVLNLILEPGENSLDQVVVVSYGKQRQRDITGAVSKINAGEVQDVAAAEFGQKLQGKVAGLQLGQTTGRPGQGMTFRIRGAASLSSGNQPLVVVDGQPIISDLGQGAGLINPDEIESYSVLKDASATALYGSRAANGVIIITTKQGKLGRTNVTASSYYGQQKLTKRGHPNLMNAHEFATYMKGYYEDKALYEVPATVVPDDYKNPDQYGKGTDWYSAIFRTAPIENYSVNLSSGTEKLLSSTTFSYFHQDGILYNTSVKRYSVRSNNEYRPVDRIRLGLNIAPTYQIDHNTRGSIDGNRQIISGSQISSPLIAPYNADGSYILKTGSFGMYTTPNFLQQQKLMNVNQNNMHLLSNAYLDIEVIKGLHAKSTFNIDYTTQDYNAYYGTMYATFGSVPPRPITASSAVNSSNNSFIWLNENTLDYSAKIKEHSVEVLAGYSAQKYSKNLRSVNGSGFANDAVPWISGATTTTGSTSKQSWTMASAFARLNYDFEKKYFLTATIRRDGHSRFGEFKKYGVFPSISAGWIVSDESFFPKAGPVSFLKIKGSYGLTGNNNLGGSNDAGNYLQASQLSGTNYVFNNTTTVGESITSLGNKVLTWETSKQTDVGVEMNFLKNRITFSYDYYNKRTEGMLANLQIPFASGYASIAYNLGTFRIWGHEFQVSSRNLVGEFSWNTDFNISFNDNKVLSLINNTPIGGTGKYNDYNRTAVGHRIGELYGYIFDGLYMNQADFDKYPKETTSAVGTARMRDVNGDDTINISDRTFIGRTNPKFIFGFSNNFQYKGFDLSIVTSGQVGNKLMDINMQNKQNLDGIFNIDKDMANRWRSEANPGNGKVPRTKSNTTELYRSTNTNWVFSGDYLTVKNLTLGYTFKQSALRYIKSVRVYGSAQQLFVFTKYPGQNPEVNDFRDDQTKAGLDNGSYPVPRTFMIGANINF
ncbi:SusC/RagA family TonB-linked outer membrane protein [Flavitalea flava]